jgi:hypothetical protein
MDGFIVCGVYFEIDYCITMLSLHFGSVGRLCLLNVAIPDMHISPFFFSLKDFRELDSSQRVYICPSHPDRAINVTSVKM